MPMTINATMEYSLRVWEACLQEQAKKTSGRVFLACVGSLVDRRLIYGD